MRRKFIAPILLIVLINLVLSVGKVNGQFLADDFFFNLKASTFVFSFKNLFSLAFFEHFADFFRPIPIMVWVFLYKLFGLAPVYDYMVLSIFHIANCVLVYFLVGKLFREEVALVSACIFSVFTGHLEAQLWLACMFDVLCTLFFLLSLLLLVSFLNTRRLLLYAASLIFSILAILSKEMAVTLPAVVFATSVIWYWEKGLKPRFLLSSVMLSIPYCVLVLLCLGVRLWVLRSVGVRPPSYLSFFAPKALLNYPALFANLIVPHYRGELVSSLLPFAAGAFAIALIIRFIGKKESRPAIALGLVWVLVTAFPTIEFINYRNFFIRFNYLPAVGFCLVVGQMIAARRESALGRKLFALLACLVIGLYSVNTIYHAHAWKKAWRMSRDVQKSFRADVRPILEEPARAYFFGVPEFTNGIIVFSTGLPECFSLLGKKGDFDYFTSAGRGLPRVELPKRATLERRATNYYLFDWNPLTGHFRQTGPSFRDSQPFRPGTNILVSWNFSKRSDISQWRLTDGQLIPSDENVQPYTFVTRSANSLLKSPRIGRRVKYVEITCRVTAPAKIPLSGQLSWMTTTDLVSDTKKAIVFPVNNDGSAHTYWLPLYINGWSLREPIAHLALRLSDHPATTIEVESVTLYSF